MPRTGAPGSAAAAHGIVKPDRVPASEASPRSGGEASDGGSGVDSVPEPPSTSEEPQSGSERPQRASKRSAPSKSSAPAKSAAPTVVVAGGGNGAVSSGAGFLLGLVFWGWVALPFLKGGPDGVKNMLKAKFLNKAPDGSWLP